MLSTFVIVSFALTGLSTVIVGLRFYCRYCLKGLTAAHDYVILSALLLTWGNAVLNYYQSDFGKMAKFAILQKTGAEKSAGIRLGTIGTLLTWYIYRFTYIINLYLVKLSILLFYRVIATTTWFRRANHITLIFVTLYSIAMVLASIFQCQNPSDAYSFEVFLSQFTKKYIGKCFDPSPAWCAQAGINLFTDVVILILPLPSLLRLKAPISKRLALVAIFSVGIICIVASCIRISILVLWGESGENASKYGSDVVLWGQVEVNCGIVCASFPFLQSLFKRDSAGGRPKVSPPQPRKWPVPRSWRVPPSTKDIESVSADSSDHLTMNTTVPFWSPFITVPESLSTQCSRETRMSRSPEHDVQWPLSEKRG